LDGRDVGNVQVGLGLVAVLVGVAQVAVDLPVGAFGAELQVVQWVGVMNEPKLTLQPRQLCRIPSQFFPLIGQNSNN